MKEQLRIEVRRELDKLEANCRDMASLLRGLGINTGGGLYPLSSEVSSALFLKIAIPSGLIPLVGALI